MNIHHLSFEDLLNMCSSLEDPGEINKMILALEIMEKNLGYQRQRLAGMLAVDTRQHEEKRQKDRQRLKQSFKIFRNPEDKDPTP